jgi:hypothetical protein
LIVEDITDADFRRIRELYGQRRYGFVLPEPKDPLVVIKKKLVDEDGVIGMVAFGRLLLNGYLVVDRSWRTPAMRLEGIELIEDAMIQAAIMLGHDEAIVQVDRRFGERLRRLGWEPGLGVTWTKEIKS